MHSSRVLLEDDWTAVHIVPGEGARIQSIVDRTSGRELLLQRAGAPGPRVDFLDSCTGGWDELFPNDSPWEGHQDHGEVWTAPFDAVEEAATTVTMRCEISSPGVSVERRIRLLGEGRRGVRADMRVRANEDTGPFLWAAHPMLAVSEGWIVELPDGARNAVADAELPGRHRAGPLDEQALAATAIIPSRESSVCEVVYVDGLDSAQVRSPEGSSSTRVQWDADFLRHLWIVVITGAYGLDDCLLIEPSTSRPYRLEEAVAAGTAARLDEGEEVRWFVTVESCDRT